MINFTFKGHKISIRNDDWKKLKERFNPDNVEKRLSYFIINKKCSLCERYHPNSNCRECPFGVLGRIGCSNLLRSILRKFYFDNGQDYIEWNAEDDAQARRQLKAILRRMEKIEASQKEA